LIETSLYREVDRHKLIETGDGRREAGGGGGGGGGGAEEAEEAEDAGEAEEAEEAEVDGGCGTKS